MSNISKKREISELSSPVLTPSRKPSEKIRKSIVKSPQLKKVLSEPELSLDFNSSKHQISVSHPKLSLSPSSLSSNKTSFSQSINTFCKSPYENELTSLDRLIIKLKIEIELIFQAHITLDELSAKIKLKEVLMKHKNYLCEHINEIAKGVNKDDSPKFEKRLSLDSEKNTTVSPRSQSILNMDYILNEINAYKEKIGDLEKDLVKKNQLLRNYELKIAKFQEEKDREGELNKKVDVSQRIFDFANEKSENLYKSYDRSIDTEAYYEERRFSTSSPKEIKNKSEFDEYRMNKMVIETLKYENKELQKDLELASHNYEHLCGKFHIQSEEFTKFKSFYENKEEIHAENFKKIKKNINMIHFKLFHQDLSNNFLNNTENICFIILQIDKKIEEMAEKIKKLEKSEEDSKSARIKEGEIFIKYEKELEALKNKNFALESENNELNQKFENEKDQILKFSKLKSNEKEKLEREIKLANMKIEKLLNEKSVKECENLSLMREIEKVKFTFMNNENQIGYLEENFENKVKDLMNEKETMIMKFQNLIKIKDAEMDDLMNKNHSLSVLINEKERNFQSIQEELDQFSVKNEKILQESERLKEKINELENFIEEKEKIIEELENQNKNQININKNLRENISEVKKEMNQAHQIQIDAKNKEFSELKLKFSEKEKEVQILSENIANLNKKYEDDINKHKDKKRVMKEKYENKKQELKKYEMMVMEKDYKYKELSDNQQNSISKITDSLKDLKKVIKEKYKKSVKQDLQQLQTACNEKDSENARLKYQNDDLSQKLTEKSEILQQKQGLLSQKESEIQQLQEKSKGLEEIIEKYKYQNQEDENLIFSLNQNLLKIESENENLRKENEEIMRERQDLIEEKNHNEEQLKRVIENLENDRRIESPSKIRDDSLNESNEDVSEHINKLLEELNNKESFIKKNNKRVLDLQWKNRDLIETLKDYETKVSENAMKIDRMNVNIQDLIQENEKLNNNIKTSGIEIDGLKEALRNKTNEYEDKISDLMISNNVLQESVKSMSDEISSHVTE